MSEENSPKAGVAPDASQANAATVDQLTTCEEPAKSRLTGMDASLLMYDDVGETTLTETSKNNFDLKAYLETAGKLAASLGAVCYLTGLFVININLSQYGYFSLSLLNVRYILAGVWAFIPLLLWWILRWWTLSSISREIEEDTKKSKEQIRKLREKLENLKRIREKTGDLGLIGAKLFGGPKWVMWSVAIFSNLLALFAGILAIVALFYPRYLSLWSGGMPWGLRLIYTTILAAYVVATLPTSEKRLSGFLSRIVKSPGVTLLFFFAYLLIFARFQYSAIPSFFGGGRPQMVRLVVSPTEQQSLIACGLSFPENSIQSAPIRLLLATSENYILLPKGSEENITPEIINAIEVRRDLVQAIIYESSQ